MTTPSSLAIDGQIPVTVMISFERPVRTSFKKGMERRLRARSPLRKNTTMICCNSYQDRSSTNNTEKFFSGWSKWTGDRNDQDPKSVDRIQNDAPSDCTARTESSPSPPSLFVNRRGHTIAIRTYGAQLEQDEFEPLVSMYGAFDAADRAYGLPPSDGDRIRAWLGQLLDELNIVAWHGDAVAGHAILVETAPETYELMVFVHRSYQRAGVGRCLVEVLIERARRTGIGDVGLVVDSRRSETVDLFRTVGFEFVDVRGHASEMTLAL